MYPGDDEYGNVLIQMCFSVFYAGIISSLTGATPGMFPEFFAIFKIKTMQSTLKSGTCTRCNSKEVYTTKGQTKRGERMTLAVSSWKSFFLDTYVCTDCGHFEEYISDEEMKDRKTWEKVRETWNKVE